MGFSDLAVCTVSLLLVIDDKLMMDLRVPSLRPVRSFLLLVAAFQFPERLQLPTSLFGLPSLPLVSI